MKNVDLNDRRTYFASYELIEELKAKYQGNDILNFAYTDYGGDFLDKVVIDYFRENFKDAIVIESTSWNGENAFVFGPLSVEFRERHPLGFRNIEEHYSRMESDQEFKDFEYFIAESSDKYDFQDGAIEVLSNEKGGYYSMTTQGLDFSWADLLEWCIKRGIASPRVEVD